MAEASEEGLGSQWAVVPMIIVVVVLPFLGSNCLPCSLQHSLKTPRFSPINIYRVTLEERIRTAALSAT